jgi:hypothetical protein
MKVAYSQTATLVNLLRHHREQPPLKGFDEDGAERWQAILQKLDELVRPVATQVEKIFGNAYLTDEGKQEAAMKIGSSTVDSFKNVGIVLNQADTAKTRLETMLFGPLTEPPTKGHEILNEMRAQELRRMIGQKDASANFFAACDRGDTETTRALLNAPGPSWLTEEVQRRGRESYAGRVNPEGLEQLKYVEVLRDNLSTLSQQVALWLRSLGASPESIQQATGITLKKPV